MFERFHNITAEDKILKKWVSKISMEALLGPKETRAYYCMNINDGNKIEFGIRPDGKKYIPGTDDSDTFLEQTEIKSFVIGHFGTYEYELFVLIRDQSKNWIAYRNDCRMMLIIDNISILDYAFVSKI
ncbi:MAG TPA: hypothetical protein PK514_11230 [Spirochaetota bacterium]|nr:hypothetical protein [Spirochaetota bacterium]